MIWDNDPFLIYYLVLVRDDSHACCTTHVTQSVPIILLVVRNLFLPSCCTWPFQLQTVIITWVLINSSGRGPTPIVGTKVTDQSQLSPASTQYTEVNCSLTKAEIEPGRKVVRLTLMHRQHRCRILFTHNMQTKTLKCSMGIRILELKSPTNYL